MSSPPTTVTQRSAVYRGRKLPLKANGLPDGYGLYWVGSEKKYIYAKLHGVPFSCKTDDWRVAVDLVETKRAEHTRRENGIVVGDVLVKELLDDLIVYYGDLGKKRGDYRPDTAYIVTTQINMKNGIRETFEGLKASKLRHDMYADYRRKMVLAYEARGKKSDRVQNTIDHHLGYLKRALRLGIDHQKVDRDVPLPKIDKANSRNGTRQGFINLDTAEKVIPLLPDWVRPIFVTCLATGIRKREATFVHRSDVDLGERLIHLRASETKVGKARTLPIAKKYWSYISDWEEETRRTHPKAEYLFHHDGAQTDVADIDKAFHAVCEAQGWHTQVFDEEGRAVRQKNGDLKWDRKGMRWHDTRRTATTTVSSLEGLTNTDILRTIGLTAETHGRYDQTDSAKKVRDAQDAKYAKMNPELPTSTTSPSQPVTGGKREQLALIKALFDEGLLDAEVYKEQQRAVMAS